MLQGMMGLGLTCFQSGVSHHSESSFNPDLAPLHHLSCNPPRPLEQSDVGRAVRASAWFSFTFLPALILTPSSSSLALVSRKSSSLSTVNNISTLHKLRPIRTESCSCKFHELSTSAIIWKQNEVQSIAAIRLHYSIMWVCDSTNTFIFAVSTLIFRSHFNPAEELSADNTFILKNFFAQSFLYSLQFYSSYDS